MEKLKNILLITIKLLILFIAVAVLTYSSIKLYNYNQDKILSEKLAKEMTSAGADESAPISVDFKKLKEENSDIIAWLYLEDSPINYPVVQAKDNAYYLKRNINKTYSPYGSLFADFSNNSNFTDNNTIIYGHNMKNNTMFATLVDYKEQDYFNNHSAMYLLTPEKNYKLEIIAGKTVNSTSEIYKLPLESEQKKEFISQFINQSDFKSGYKFEENHKYVMLSTCSYDYYDARYVLIGLLKNIK